MHTKIYKLFTRKQKDVDVKRRKYLFKAKVSTGSRNSYTVVQDKLTLRSSMSKSINDHA